MNEMIYRYFERLYKLTKVTVGNYAQIKGRGMRFDVRVFDAKGSGRLFLMEMKGMFGLMRMETATFTPVSLDAPLFSIDIVKAFGRSTLVLELYDTTVSHPDFNKLESIKKKYADIPTYDPGEHPYYTYRLPESDYKRGRGIHKAVLLMAKEYTKAYLACMRKCPEIESEEKKAKNAEFSDSLFTSGGPAVNQFKKMIGEKGTEEFLKKYMYCSQ